MEKLNANKPCPKCGLSQLIVRYRTKTFIGNFSIPEAMVVTCANCGFEYLAAPLDAKDEK